VKLIKILQTLVVQKFCKSDGTSIADVIMVSFQNPQDESRQQRGMLITLSFNPVAAHEFNATAGDVIL